MIDSIKATQPYYQTNFMMQSLQIYWWMHQILDSDAIKKKDNIAKNSIMKEGVK